MVFVTQTKLQTRLCDTEHRQLTILTLVTLCLLFFLLVAVTPRLSEFENDAHRKFIYFIRFQGVLCGILQEFWQIYLSMC